MNLKKLLSRRGAALEIAIVTMLVIFGLCMILMTVNEMIALNSARSMATSTTRKNLGVIGDDFYMAHCNSTTLNTAPYQGDYTPYEYRMTDTGGWLLLVYEQSAGTPRLGVEVSADGADCTIVRWTYSGTQIEKLYVVDQENKTAVRSSGD